MDPIWDDLRRKVDKVRGELPDGIFGPIVNDDFGDVYGIIATITGEGYTPAELKEVADEVRDEILLIPETAKVEILGRPRLKSWELRKNEFLLSITMHG